MILSYLKLSSVSPPFPPMTDGVGLTLTLSALILAGQGRDALRELRAPELGYRTPAARPGLISHPTDVQNIMIRADSHLGLECRGFAGLGTLDRKLLAVGAGLLGIETDDGAGPR
jgi:hypothetical protein